MKCLAKLSSDSPALLPSRSSRASSQQRAAAADLSQIVGRGHQSKRASQASASTVCSELARLNQQLLEANQALVLASMAAQHGFDEAQTARDRQAAFMHLLAHELRAPLAPLRNVVGLLSRVQSGESLPFVRDVIDRQVSHLANLVEDLLDTARLRTGKLSLRIVNADLLEILNASVQTCRPAVALRAQFLTVEMPEMPLPLNADPVRLTQVFSNLLSNASKYTPRGGHIGLTASVQAGELHVSIEDDGIGITPSAIDSVFEPYVQEPHAVRHDDSGLGLGLTLARELVLAHGGRIQVSSAGPGCGTRVDVQLPSAAAATVADQLNDAMNGTAIAAVPE